MATSTSLGRLITTEWIDGSSVKRSHPAASEEDFVNLEFAEELYGTLLSVFAQICRTYSKTFTVPKQRQNKEALGRLHLWGRALVQEGKLACVLAQSDDVRDTVIDLFGQIGKAVLDLADLEGCDNEFAEQVQSLQTLIARSRLIVPASESSDTGSDDDSAAGLRSKRRSRLGDAGSARRKGHFEGVKVKGDLDPELEQVEFDLESDTHTRPYDLRTDRSRNGTSESSEDEEDGSDHDTLLECHIECLMDLVPTMEQSLARLRSGGIQAPTSTRVPFLVSDLALPWVQNVSDKFGSADQALIERLGEANWQRYMTLRARTEQMVQSLDIEEGVAEDFPVVQIFQTVPHSVFKPHSLFHDSGMGSSVPTLPRYAMSVASHTSFLSSLVDDGALALQVPPTPVEVDLGKPFRCEICGHLLSNIKNRVDWKIHVFADLQPYICTFESCSKDLTTFPTRNLWASHEFEEHRVTRSWKCPECAYTDSAAQKLEEHLRRCHGEAVTLAQLPFIIAAAETKTPQAIEGQACPLCKAIPGKSRRNFVKHVGRHMESVALAVLPRDAAEDSEQSSDRSIVSQDEEPHSPEITSETEECYFFVPPNFNIYTTLDGRDQELEVLDKYLFSERWKYGTASVLLHGPHLSGKSRLAQYYINRNRSKFPGGIFWISSRSSLLMIAQKFIWKTYKSGISTDLLASIVTAWFSSKSRWLIVLWDIYSRSDSTEEGLQPPWPAVAPNSRCSSLIYVSTFMSSNMPLSPMPLEIKPLRNTEQQRTEQNGESNISATNSDTGGIRRLPPIISTEANITADSVLHTIGAETGRLDNSARGIYGAMSEVYQDELFDEIYDPTALRTMSPQSRVTENQARPGSPQNGSLKDELKTARQSHSAPADPPPALGGLSTIGDGFDHNSEAFPNIIDYINKQDEARFDHGPQDRGPIGAISASTDIADDARTTWERSFRHVSENPPSNASPFLLSNHGAISDFPPHLTSMSIPSVSGMHLEELFDDTKSGLLMQSLPCEHPGCSVTSKSISEYTEHCEASHGEMLADMSKTLSDIRENAVKAQWLLEQPVISPKRTSRPKLTTQNLKADLFHNKQIHTTGEIEPSGYEFKPKSYDEQGEKKIAYNGTLLGGREFRPRTFLILDKGDTFFMLASECALMLGYWNSYILFDENPWLYKIILNRSEKDDLVIRKILTLSSLTREIDVVTARSMFRQFGSRIILNGRRVRDDYWEESARAQGFSISNGTRTLILPDDEVPSSSEVEDPTKAPKAATYPSINDRTHSESLALGVASNLDGSHGFFYRGFCKRCHHYDHARSIDISTMSEGHTIIKCDECELPTVILESELLSTPAHRGCLKCYVPGCDLSRDFTNERELQSHRRGLHRMHEADVRWIEETTAPGTTKYETQMSLATPYKCDEPGCSMLRDFSSRNDLRRHQQEIHKLTSTASLQGPSGREAVTQGPTLTSNTEDTIRCICGQEEYPGLAKSARDAFNSATYHNRTSRSFFAVDPEHLGSLLIQCDTYDPGDQVARLLKPSNLVPKLTDSLMRRPPLRHQEDLTSVPAIRGAKKCNQRRRQENSLESTSKPSQLSRRGYRKSLNATEKAPQATQVQSASSTPKLRIATNRLSMPLTQHAADKSTISTPPSA
ncbi:hypothetical protein MMC11_006194 [Xylographa trunciseda]|nr:hypothetical protein [Xylographa trunciseda]